MKTWIKNNGILILVIIVLNGLFVYFITNQFIISNFNHLGNELKTSYDDLNTSYQDLSKAIVFPYCTLDFQNKSGVTKIQSSFCDLLVCSDGSIQKGNGYIVNLDIINPSSITLTDIECQFIYNDTKKPVVYSDVNFKVLPGYSKTVSCFISDLTDSELKSISVMINFNKIIYHIQ